MALRIRFQYPTGSKLGYSIEQLESGYVYDFDLNVFVLKSKTTTANMIKVLSEDTAPYLGRYLDTYYATPRFVFADGDYVVTVHDTAANNMVVAELAATMKDGDDRSPYA